MMHSNLFGLAGDRGGKGTSAKATKKGGKRPATKKKTAAATRKTPAGRTKPPARRPKK